MIKRIISHVWQQLRHRFVFFLTDYPSSLIKEPHPLRIYHNNLFPHYYCKVRAKGTVENELNHGKWVISTFGALQVMLGQEGMEGLGFSMDAVPPWIVSAPFWEDKTWYRRILDTR